MAVIGIRELARETRKVLDRLKEDGEPVIVARHGEPVAVLSVPTRAQLVDADLAATPEFRESLDQADQELVEGKTKPFDQVLADIEAEEGGREAETETATSPRAEATYFDELVGAASEDFAAWVVSRVPGEYVQEAQRLNADLINGLVEESVGEALCDVRSINEELVSIAQESEDVSEEEYLALLKALIAVKKARRRRPRPGGALSAWALLDERTKEVS
jgi:prevent-host-death family protein